MNTHVLKFGLCLIELILNQVEKLDGSTKFKVIFMQRFFYA